MSIIVEPFIFIKFNQLFLIYFEYVPKYSIYFLCLFILYNSNVFISIVYLIDKIFLCIVETVIDVQFSNFFFNKFSYSNKALFQKALFPVFYSLAFDK